MSAHQTTTERTPDLDIDLYSDEAILNPYPLCREIRDAGAAAWLRRRNACFAQGVYPCAGTYLAELEMGSLLRAMVSRAGSIEVCEPAIAMNNVLHGYESFRSTFRAAR